jgi:ATP-dependent Lon protease
MQIRGVRHVPTPAGLRRLLQMEIASGPAGLRDLERRIEVVYRKMATLLAEGRPLPERVDGADLDDFIGVPRYRSVTLLGTDEVGVVTVLA